MFKLLKLSLKKGLGTPSLPERIYKIHNMLIVRIFRLIGIVSFVIVSLNYNGGFLDKNSIVIILIILVINFVYETWIFYHRVKHMKKVLKSEELDIRN